MGIRGLGMELVSFQNHVSIIWIAPKHTATRSKSFLSSSSIFLSCTSMAISALASSIRGQANSRGWRKSTKKTKRSFSTIAKTPFSFPQNKTNLARRAYYTDLFGLLCTVENVQLGEDHHQMGSCQSTEATGGNGEVVSPVPDNKRLAESAVVSACT